MLNKIIGYMKRFEFGVEDTVMAEGDIGDFFYVQVEGSSVQRGKGWAQL